jgi:hypothetical protein
MDARLLSQSAMQELFARTVSQALQAFMPVAIAFVWLDRTRRAELRRALVRGLIAAVPLTVMAAGLFERSPLQARWEATMAIAPIVAAAGFRLRSSRWAFAVAAAACLIVVRQTMLIGAGFSAAAIQMHSFAATAIVVSATVLALTAAIVSTWIGKAALPRAVVSATLTFSVVFLAQLVFSAIHKSAEAGWLPWSAAIDSATEPYGPDSAFGRGVSYALAMIPLIAAASAAWTLSPASRRRRTAFAGVAVAAGAAGIIVAGPPVRAFITRHGGETPIAAASVNPLPVVTSSHLVFISTSVDANYRAVNVAPIGDGGGTRVSTSLRCDRVSFAAGQGICLQTDRGLFTTHRAVLLDDRLQPRHSFTLEGAPSRTRVSPDGRLGAITVFVAGQLHGYSSSAFSTKTVLLDMASGDVIADLEQFTTWRDGKRFSAADFNFWGVTFARDGNTFYASLRTAAGSPPQPGPGGRRAQTYLVRGDVGLRKLTVLHENVECPSLSPDNRLIAYKKRVGPDRDPWRYYVLDLATMTERPIAGENRSIDDQIEWFDARHVLYAAPRSDGSSIVDVYLASIDGAELPRLFVPASQSPIVVR